MEIECDETNRDVIITEAFLSFAVRTQEGVDFRIAQRDFGIEVWWGDQWVSLQPDTIQILKGELKVSESYGPVSAPHGGGQSND